MQCITVDYEVPGQHLNCTWIVQVMGPGQVPCIHAWYLKHEKGCLCVLWSSAVFRKCNYIDTLLWSAVCVKMPHCIAQTIWFQIHFLQRVQHEVNEGHNITMYVQSVILQFPVNNTIWSLSVMIICDYFIGMADSHMGSNGSAMIGVTRESNIPYNYIIIVKCLIACKLLRREAVALCTVVIGNEKLAPSSC